MFGLFKSTQVAELSANEAHDRARKGEIQLVDVREAGEWAQMHIAGAVHMPLSLLAQRLPTLPTGKPIVFYCLSGNRSKSAIGLCRQLGLAHETHMAGGITAWRAAGHPVTR